MEVKCPHCQSSHFYVKFGFYSRYRFGSSELIRIQRYKCKKHKENVTFSILPFPYMRIIRHCLAVILWVTQLMEDEQLRQHELCRLLNLSRGVVKRLIQRGTEITQWFRGEAHHARWGPKPWIQPSSCWTAFCQQFSIAIYPCSGPH